MHCNTIESSERYLARLYNIESTSYEQCEWSSGQLPSQLRKIRPLNGRIEGCQDRITRITNIVREILSDATTVEECTHRIQVIPILGHRQRVSPMVQIQNENIARRYRGITGHNWDALRDRIRLSCRHHPRRSLNGIMKGRVLPTLFSGAESQRSNLASQRRRKPVHLV